MNVNNSNLKKKPLSRATLHFTPAQNNLQIDTGNFDDSPRLEQKFQTPKRDSSSSSISSNGSVKDVNNTFLTGQVEI